MALLRTVALQATWHVVWSSIRGAGVRAWDASMAQHWDSAIKGASAQSAGTLRRLLGELGVLSGMDTMSVFWDVEKFYGSLSIPELVGCCPRKGFNKTVAAMDLQVHLGLRLLRWQGNFGQPIAPCNSVLAGSKL